jgi:MFS family permease
MIVVLITGENYLHIAWRICLGLGIIPPLSLLYLRIKLDEPESFKKETMAKTTTPWWLCVKFYWFRLMIVSAIWLVYDFSAYAFGIFSSQVLTNLLGDNEALWVSFGWNTLLTFFYMPGCIAGAWLSDWVGPRNALGYSVLAQGIVGFIMAGCYSYLYQLQYIAGFVIVYGVFIALGELGPGDNIGLIVSKTCATAVRGKYYGIAAAFGKVGAFIGSKTLIILYNHYAENEPIKAGQYPFFIASSLCIFSAAVSLFLLPHIGQDTIEEEDTKFRVYLDGHGYDVSTLGLFAGESTERIVQKAEDKTIA